MQTDAQRRKYIQMTESPVEPLICKMAVPTIISMLITSIYNMADTFFVGRLGTSATGAVGVVFPLMALIQAVGFFFGQGSGNYISRQLGAQHREEAERMASTGFFSALGAGCIIMALGLLLRHPLAHLLGATDTILPYALDYMCIILIGAPYMTASLVLNNQLRLQGNAVYAMIGLVSGGVLNMALDPLFIFTFGMGIRGAALATILSQLVGFCLLLTRRIRFGRYPHPAVPVFALACTLRRPRARRHSEPVPSGTGLDCGDLPQYGGAALRRCGYRGDEASSPASASSQARR